MRVISFLFILFLILLGVSFACLNAEPVLVNFYIGTSKLPLSLLLVFTLIFGLLLGLFFNLIYYMKLRRTNRRLNQRLKIVEEEVSNLRAIPLKSEP